MKSSLHPLLFLLALLQVTAENAKAASRDAGVNPGQTSSSPAQASDARASARVYFEAREYGKVLAMLPANGADLETILLRAKSLLWSGASAGAEAELRSADAPLAGLPVIRVCLADALLAQSRDLEAETELNAVLQAEPEHPDAKSILKRLLSQRRNGPERTEFEHLVTTSRLLQLEDEPQLTQSLIEDLTVQLSNVASAKVDTAFELVSRHWKDAVRRERLFIEVDLRHKRERAALTRILALLEVSPNDEPLVKRAGDLACALAWTALAERKFEEARKVSGAEWPAEKPECLVVALAQSQLILGEFKQSQSTYSILLARTPDSVDILFGAAEAALSADDLSLADVHLEKLEKLDAADRKRTRGLRLNYDLRSANAAIGQGEPTKAEVFARHALTQDPKSPDAFVLLSASLRSQRREEEATKVLRSGLKRLPNSAKLHLALARMPGDHAHAPLAKRALSFPLPENQDERLDLELGLGDAYVEDGDLDAAERAYRKVLDSFPNSSAVSLRLASISMRREDPFTAHQQVQAVYERDPSFETTLTFADVHHALGLESDAHRLGSEALRMKPGQPDAKGFLERLAFAHAPTLAARATHTWDNGTNLSWEFGLRGSLDLNPDRRLSMDASRRYAWTVATGDNAVLDSFQASLRERINARMVGELGLGASRVSSADRDGVLPNGFAKLEYRATGQHRITLSYDGSAFSYTAGMLRDHVGLHALGVSGNGPFVGPLSFYSASSAAYLTDANWRLLSFNSIYCDFIRQPTVKAGLNGQILGFTSNELRSYFSPWRLLNAEAFGEVLQDALESRLLYGALIALGYQKINDLEWQDTYRLGAMLGARPLTNLKLVIRAQTSNSSTSNVVGFQYYEVGGIAEWTF